MNPCARQQDLETRSVGEESVVYDLRTDRVHVLQPAVARLWHLSDGTRSVADLADLVRATVDPDFDGAAALSALAALEDADLLAVPPARPPWARVRSRRDMIRDVTVAGAIGTMPGILSILAPTPARAQSMPGEEEPKEEYPPEEEKKEEPKEEEPPEEPKEEEPPEEPKEEEPKEEEPPEEEKKEEPKKEEPEEALPEDR